MKITAKEEYDKISKIKSNVEYYSFFLQNSNSGFSTKEKDYVYFYETGLKGVEKTMPRSLWKEFGKSTRFIETGRDKKLKTKLKLIKVPGSLLNNEEEAGKKIALFLDKKVIDLLQKNACPPKKEVTQYLPPDPEIRKYYKLMFLLKNSVIFLKHDPRCIHQTFIEAKNSVFLLNSKIRPKELLKQLVDKNERWFWRETLLRHLIKPGGSNETGCRDIVVCKLIPKNTAFIAYEYDSLWLWFDIKSIEKVGKELFTTIYYCAKVIKKCTLFYPFNQYSKIGKNQTS